MSRKAGPVVTNDGAISVAHWDTTTLNDEGSYWCDAKFGDAGTLTSSTAVLYIRGRLLACHLLVASTALTLNTTSFSCPVLRSKTCQGMRDQLHPLNWMDPQMTNLTRSEPGGAVSEMADWVTSSYCHLYSFCYKSVGLFVPLNLIASGKLICPQLISYQDSAVRENGGSRT